MKLSFSIKPTIAVVAAIGLLTACHNGEVNSSPLQQPLNFATISQHVPLLENTSTIGDIILHNNSDSDIADITYEALANGDKVAQEQFKLLDNNCNAIKAHSYCNVKFSASLSDIGIIQGGSSTILAHYPHNGTNFTTAAQINYATTKSEQISFVQNTQIANESGNQYTTMYIVNPTNDSYSLANIMGDNLQVLDDKKDKSITPQSVMAIPVSIIKGKSASKVQATLADNSSHQSLNLTTTLSSITPVGAKAFLTYGSIPIQNGESSLSGTIVITNSGNTNAVISTVTSSTANLSVTGCSNQTLNPTTSPTCTLNYAIESGGYYSSSATITITYDNGQTTATATPTLYWMFANGPLVSTSMTGDPYAIFHPVGGTATNFATINLTNTNKYPVTITNESGFVINNSGAAAVSVNSSSDTCTSTSLNVNNTSCSTSFNVVESGLIQLQFSSQFRNSTGTLMTYKSSPNYRANVYNSGVWTTWGNQNSITSVATNRSVQMTLATINPSNKQVYVMAYNNLTTSWILYKYNGESWLTLSSLSVPNTQTLTSQLLQYNPVSNKLWFAYWTSTNTTRNMYLNIAEFNESTATWTNKFTSGNLFTSPGTATTPIPPQISAFAMDSSGNFYLTYPDVASNSGPSSTIAYSQLNVQKLAYGASSLTLLQQLTISGRYIILKKAVSTIECCVI